MPTTIEQRERSMHQPAFCELLPVRDIVHDVIVRTTVSFRQACVTVVEHV